MGQNKKSTALIKTTKYFPRNENILLVFGLLCTILGKISVLNQYNLLKISLQTAKIFIPDIFFLLAVLLLIRFFYIIKPSKFNARIAYIIAWIVTLWSVLNLAWTISEKVQLQPGVLFLLLRDFKYFVPFIEYNLKFNLWQTVFISISIPLVIIYSIWGMIRPKKLVQDRKYHLKIALIIAVIFVSLLPLQIMRVRKSFDSNAEILDFSSHWYAIASLVAGNTIEKPVENKNVSLEGQRQISLSDANNTDLPSVVLILLESASYSFTSLSDSKFNTTPFLAQLAENGIEFKYTRVPAAHTTKSIFAALTGTYPVMDSSYVESVPAASKYESLATILKRYGYRSAFFQMATGSFECSPGLVSNLGFDYAWFRENLEQPSADLGYMAGDDIKMIDPALDWLKKDNKPFLLTMVTSVTHDPFQLPQGFGNSSQIPVQRYMRTMEYTDIFLKQLCTRLENENYAKNTLFCIIGDHGTSFRMTAGRGRWKPNEEVLRVPWVIYSDKLKIKKKVDVPCSQIDVTPTILSLMGTDISKADFEGINAAAAADKKRKFYFFSWYEDSPVGFVSENNKIVYWPCLDKIFKFDLAADPNEDRPIIVSAEKNLDILNEIGTWQNNRKIFIPAKRHTRQRLYDHWQTFSLGRFAWAYYVP